MNNNSMVSIIIVNYNGYKDTCELIDSLKKYETYPFEIIVVDNASAGKDLDLLKDKYADIVPVTSSRNLGFAGGNNLGYEYSKGDYILYINNDVLVKSSFLQILIDRLNSDPKIAAVSPKIKYTYAPNIIQYAGYTPMSPITIRNHMIGEKQVDTGQYNVAIKTAFLHGACMLTSRYILEKVGKMSNVFFLFYEELDWSLFLQRRGYEVWYEPAAVIFHKESMSIPKNTPLRQFYLTRSRLIFSRRNAKGKIKYLVCLYQILMSFPKNILICVCHFEWKMLIANCKGIYRGLLDPKDD